MLPTLRAMRFRLCQADRDTYGDPPAHDDGWITFDPAALVEMPASRLQDIEDTTGFRIAWFWVPSMRVSAHGQRAAVWIARRLAGAVDTWADFDPRVMLADTTLVGAGDADPPGSGSVPGSPGAP